MSRDSQTTRVITSNRRARHEYHVLEEIECGIVLTGTEVKSLRAGRASIAEAYGLVRQGELFLLGANIPEYAHGNINNHAPARERKLLLHAKQLSRWDRSVREKGITLVPLELYFQGHLVKVRMALVRGKKLYDKREAQKKKDASRDMDREMGRRR
ncbi:MAG: SsrA-binding protein SmpB [Planctomycetota bacterium]